MYKKVFFSAYQLVYSINAVIIQRGRGDPSDNKPILIIWEHVNSICGIAVAYLEQGM